MWKQLLNNSHNIEKIFTIEPELKNILLKKIILEDLVADISIFVDLNDFPQSPPQKWLSLGYNTVELEIRLIAVSDIEIKNWNGNHYVDIKFEGIRNKNISFKISGDKFSLIGKSEFIDITKISAYKNIKS